MKFAVGFINNFDNILVIEICEGVDWREAVTKHSQTIWSVLEVDPSSESDSTAVPNNLEEAQQQAFDCDTAFACVEVPE